jgi:hypothetical protein
MIEFHEAITVENRCFPPSVGDERLSSLYLRTVLSDNLKQIADTAY